MNMNIHTRIMNFRISVMLIKNSHTIIHLHKWRKCTINLWTSIVCIMSHITVIIIMRFMECINAFCGIWFELWGRKSSQPRCLYNRWSLAPSIESRKVWNYELNDILRNLLIAFGTPKSYLGDQSFDFQSSDISTSTFQTFAHITQIRRHVIIYDYGKPRENSATPH